MLMSKLCFEVDAAHFGDPRLILALPSNCTMHVLNPRPLASNTPSLLTLSHCAAKADGPSHIAALR
jgi:hypothetical protein